MAQVNAHQLLTSQLFNPAMLDGETLLSWLKVQELKKGQAAAGDLGTAGSGPNSQVQNTPSMAVQRKASTGGGSMDRDDEEDDESAVKIRYICLTSRKNRIRLHKVKLQHPLTAQIAKTWNLDELRAADNLKPHLFTVTLNKHYRWAVDDAKKKIEFLYMLVKLCQENLKKQPKFNFTEEGLKNELTTYENRERMLHSTQEDYDSDTESLPGVSLSPLEEALLCAQQSQTNLNVNEVLSDYNWEVGGDAAALEARLVNELTALEAANIHAIIQAEEQAASVVEALDRALNECQKMDEWLSRYHFELQNNGQEIRQIERQNKGLQVQSSNQKALLQELEKVMNILELPDEAVKILQQEGFESAESIEKLEKAALKLQQSLHTKLDDNILQLAATKERITIMGKCSVVFAERLVGFLTKLIQQQVNALISTNAPQDFKPIGGIMSASIPKHTDLEELLFKYRKLISWLKEMDPRNYTELQIVYARSINQLFMRDCQQFLELLVASCSLARKDESEFLFVGSRVPSGGPSNPVRGGILRHKKTLSAGGSAGADQGSSHSLQVPPPNDLKALKRGASSISSASISVSEANQSPPDVIFKHLWIHIMPVMVREHSFMTELFLFPGSRALTAPMMELLESLNDHRPAIKDIRASRRLEELLSTAFEGLLDEIHQLIDYALRIDPTLVISFLATLETILKETNPQSYTRTLLISLHGRLEQQLDRLFEDQTRAVDETRITLKKRSGILSFIRTFPLFCRHVEGYLKEVEPGLGVRQRVHAGYVGLSGKIFENLEVVVRETESLHADDKEQLNAHILQLENMHHYYTELRGQKLACLDSSLKQAKSDYDQHLSAYIRTVVRKPLGRLLDFFEGVETVLQQMTNRSPEEVSFHLTYNKAALKKMLSTTSGKEIKKSLESLYKRVEKHYCQEEGLLQVVWHGIQEECIRRHQHYEQLMVQCYPGSDLHLPFSIQDLCSYFSDIALSH